MFNRKSSRYTLPAMLAAILLVGCAKELPEKVSEDIEKNVHSMALFDQEVVIETIDEPGVFAVKAEDTEVNGVFALNEMKLRKVKVVSGDPKLAEFFKDLKIESASAGERLKVAFRLTDNVMLAFANHEGQTLSLHQQELLAGRELPLFQFSVSSYGILDKVENDLGEKTHIVTYKRRDRGQSTHVTIDPTVEERVDAGLRASDFDDSSVVIDKRKLHSQVYTIAQIKRLFNNNAMVEAEVSNEKPARLKFHQDKIIVLRPVKKKNLNPIELAALTRSPADPRIMMCDEKIRELTELKKDECVLRPAFTIDAKGVKLKRKTDNNKPIATVDLDSNIDHRQAKMIEVNLNSQVNRYRIGEDISFADKVFTSKEDHYDTESVYLYVPMTGSTPRGVTEADPFYQGKEKLVKLRFAKAGLEVVEVERDERFQFNPLNQYPVMTIPGEHIDYKCSEDDNNQCLTGDEQDDSKTWDQKRFFIPSLDSMQLTEVNPLDLWNVSGNPCVVETGKRVTQHEVKKGVIFVEVEKTYRKIPQAIDCIIDDYYEDSDDFTGLSTSAFKTKFTYSLVRLEDITSKDYKTVQYPIPDHGSFGFFTNTQSDLDDQFDPSRLNKQNFLHRWNPEKKKVVYFLSDTYNEPGQELIKKATFAAVDTINNSLRRANAGFEIVLKEPAGKNSGDLRNNVLQLITDPLANGLLGYAPTVTNPLTGEIVQSHINMYSGVLKTLSRRVWEQMVDLTIEQRDAANPVPAVATPTPAPVADEQTPAADTRIADFNAKQALKTKLLAAASMHNHSDHIEHNAPILKERLKQRLRTKHQAEHQAPRAGSFEEKAQKYMKRLDRWAQNNAYSKEFFPIAGTVKALYPGIKQIAGVLNADGTLKRWKELSREQKKAAEDIMIPNAYTTTLVHEFGHALGLRHNFIGSFDHENFYTQEEAQALGMHNRPAYSSIMDYGYSELNELPQFGKYDVAALRFGYAREVELADGSFARVETSLHDLEKSGAQLKPYQFCTDENTRLSATCNRFDEGSSLVEVVTHYIDNYERSYKYRNFRDDRDSFSAYNLPGYLIARYHEFNRIRDLMEEWEFFAEIFGPGIMEQGCSPQQTAQIPVCKMINDRAESVKIAGDFMLKVLKTPDHLCALANANDPAKTVELRPLSKIYEGVRWDINYVPTSCFDPAVKEAMAADTNDENQPAPKVVKGEAGKFLNGFKDNDPNHIYASDRYVLGVWIDKLMAMKSLFQRETGRPTTDDNFGALVDHSYFAPKVFNFIEHLVMGTELSEKIAFKNEAGAEYQENYAIDNSYLVLGPVNGLDWMRSFLRLPSQGKGVLNAVLLETAKAWGLSDDDLIREESRSLVNTFTVRKNDISDTVNGEFLKTLRVGERIYAAGEANQIASVMVDSIKAMPTLARLGQEKTLAIFQDRRNPALPADLSEAQVAAATLPDGLLGQLTDLLEQGATFTEEQLIGMLGEELGKQTFLASTLGAPALREVQVILSTLGKAPADASADVKAAYEMNLIILRDFLTGQLEGKNTLYRDRIEMLPTHVRQ